MVAVVVSLSGRDGATVSRLSLSLTIVLSFAVASVADAASFLLLGQPSGSGNGSSFFFWCCGSTTFGNGRASKIKAKTVAAIMSMMGRRLLFLWTVVVPRFRRVNLNLIAKQFRSRFELGKKVCLVCTILDNS